MLIKVKIIFIGIIILIRFQSLAQNSCDISTTDTLVNLLFSNGLYESARVILEKERAKDKNKYDEKYCCLYSRIISNYKVKANDLKQKGRWKEAIELYERIIKIYPETEQFYLPCLHEIANILGGNKKNMIKRLIFIIS